MCDTSRRKTYGQGQVIFRENEVGDTAFVLIEGEVVLTKNGDQAGRSFVCERISGSGKAFGLLPLIDHGPRMATATAVTNGTICETVNAAVLDGLLEKSSPFVNDLVRVLSFRLRNATRRLTMDVKTKNPEWTGEVSLEETQEAGQKNSNRREFKAGDIIFREGIEAEFAYILESGRVELTIIPDALMINLYAPSPVGRWT